MSGEELKKFILNEGYELKSIAEAIGISPQALNSRLNAKDVKHSTIEEVASAINKSVDYVIKRAEPVNNIPILARHERDNRFIRYWSDVDVTGGGVVLFDDTLSDNYEDMLIPDFNDCTDAVNLYGDSMSPRYNAGQIIILKEWTDSFIAYGQVYLVITKSGFRTVKYLRKGVKDNEVLCVSENKNYDPFPVNREDILKLYLVKGTIEKTTL